MTEPVKAVLGPTNTGKTHLAIERMCGHSSGIMAFPLRLLAREAFDRVVRIKGESSVALITGEQRISPPQARYFLCTTESAPTDIDTAFAAVDEVQIATDPERGHIFTDRILNLRGREETMLLGSMNVARTIRRLVADCDVTTRPRFSKLSYAAPQKLSRLPPRTAIIAFSADDVYEIAEQLRRARGGAAIVMGSLSPATRNAQVAMYQSGEVDYIVATDAIGMGLNMDIDLVAFASLTKFDGQRTRRLRVDEMAQIAGRAGRHQRDGSFCTLALPGERNVFFPEEIERIEEHRFEPRDWLYWRNRDLDFASPDTLAASLIEIPLRRELRLAPPSDDLKVLNAVMASQTVASWNWSAVSTKRLWDACGLPDFRNSGSEHHAQLVARIFGHIGSGSNRVPQAVLQAETSRLDNVAGDIGQLTSRLAGVRTWAYAANRADWIDNRSHWIARTDEIEERLSETLHKRLVERFVEKRALRRGAGRIEPSRSDVRFDHDGCVSVLGEVVGEIEGLSFHPDRIGTTPGQRALIVVAERAWADSLTLRAAKWAEISTNAISIDTSPGEIPSIICDGVKIAGLGRGRQLIAPVIRLAPELAKIDVAIRDRLAKRLAIAVAELVATRLKPLCKMHEAAFDIAVAANLRALLARLADDGGTALRIQIDDAIAPLSVEERRHLRQTGVVLGTLSIFHPAMLKPGAMRLRLALLAAYRNQPMPPLPMPGLTLIDRPQETLRAAVLDAGFVPLADQYLRGDLAERIAQALHFQRQHGPNFVPDRALATSIGIGERTFVAMLRAMGFIPVGQPVEGRWKWRGLRSRSAASAHSEAIGQKHRA